MEISSYSEVSDSRRVFEIMVPVEELDRARQNIADRLARRVSLPGFRKGHVPSAVIEKRFASEIREELIENMVPDALTRAIREKGVQPIGNPSIENVRFEEGQPLAFRANVDVRPAVDPGEYRGLPVADAPVEPTDAEIEISLRRLQESRAEFLPIEGRPARDGDYAIADVASRFIEREGPVVYTASGEESPGSEKAGEWSRDEKLMLEIGHAETMPEINETLRGMSPSEVKTFRKSFPAEFQNPRYAGKTLDYEVSLIALKERILPELTDDFVKEATGLATTSALRARVAEGVRAEKEAARRRSWRRQILDRLGARVTATPPANLVEAEVESSLENFASHLASRGVDPKAQDWDRLATEARPGAESRVREFLVLDEIARREEISASETEVDAAIRRLAADTEADFLKLKERLRKERKLDRLTGELRLEKTLDWLVAQAAVEPGAAS